MTQVDVVLFDLGGVLFDYQPANRWNAFAELTGLEPDEVRKRLSGSGFSLACDQGAYRGTRAYSEGVRLLGTRLSMERFVATWVSAFTPSRRVLELARAAKKRASVAILSNNSDLVRQGLEARWPEQLAPFMPRIFSADLGITKPDPRIFAQAAALVGQPAERLLLIDDASANIASAAALGLQTHQFSNPQALEHALRLADLL